MCILFFLKCYLLSAVFCAGDRQLFLALACAHSHLCLQVDQRGKCHVCQGTVAQVPPLLLKDYSNAERPPAAAVFVFVAVVTVVVLHVAAADVGVAFVAVLQPAAAAVVVAVVPHVAAAAELVLSAVEMFEVGVLVVHGVAATVVVAEPQVLPTAFAIRHCFVGDSQLVSLVKQQVSSCPV